MSLELKERYVVDGSGSRVAVLLDIEEYQKVLDALEELEAISAYDEAQADSNEAITFEQAIAEIESQRDELRYPDTSPSSEGTGSAIERRLRARKRIHRKSLR
jgi:hypothetical protein